MSTLIRLRSKLLTDQLSLWWRQVGVLEGVFDLVSGQYFALFVEDDQCESGFEFTLLMTPRWCEVDVFFVAAVRCPHVGEFESAMSVCSDVEQFAVDQVVVAAAAESDQVVEDCGAAFGPPGDVMYFQMGVGAAAATTS